MPCSFNFEQNNKVALTLYCVFYQQRPLKKKKISNALVGLFLALSFSELCLQSVSSCPPVSWVCFLSALFMWHGCDYLLPALPWPAHVLIITPSKCCSILTLALHSVSIALLSTGAVSFIGQVLGSATCFVFLRAVSPITDSGLCWHVPVILNELRCGLVSSGT